MGWILVCCDPYDTIWITKCSTTSKAGSWDAAWPDSFSIFPKNKL